MTDRDRLIKLLNVDMSGCEGNYAEEMADYLIKKRRNSTAVQGGR